MHLQVDACRRPDDASVGVSIAGFRPVLYDRVRLKLVRISLGKFWCLTTLRHRDLPFGERPPMGGPQYREARAFTAAPRAHTPLAERVQSERAPTELYLSRLTRADPHSGRARFCARRSSEALEPDWSHTELGRSLVQIRQAGPPDYVL